VATPVSIPARRSIRSASAAARPDTSTSSAAGAEQRRRCTALAAPSR
jgi:hypothetical protein